MKDSLLLLILSGYQFFILGVQNNLVSSITPELIEYFNVDKLYINFIYAAPYIVAFLLVLFVYNILLKDHALSVLLFGSSILFVLSTMIFCGVFLFQSKMMVIVLAVVSKLLYGVTLGFNTVSLEVLLNNRFSVSNMMMNNGIWSVILLFDQAGVVTSYIVAPILLSVSIPIFVSILFGSSVIFLFFTYYIIGHYKRDLSSVVRDTTVVPDRTMTKTLSYLMIVNGFTIGIYKSLLQFFPEILEEFFKNNQVYIAISIIAGVVLSFFIWSWMKTPTHWLQISALGIILCWAGLILILIPSFLDTVEGDSMNELSTFILIGIVFFCTGSSILFTTPNIVSVNIYSGDHIRLSFVWIVISSYISIVFFTQLFNFLISFVPYGVCGIYVISLVCFLVASYYIWSIYSMKLKQISASTFQKKSMNLLKLDTQNFKYSNVPTEQSTENEEFEKSNQVEEEMIQDEASA